MRWILTSCFFWLGLSVMESQTVVASQPLPFKADFKYEVLPMISGRTLIFKDEGFEQSLISYDTNLVVQWNNSLSFEKKRVGLIGLIPHEENFWIYYYFRDRSNVFIVSRQYDENGQTVAHDTIVQEKYLTGSPTYYFSVSPNKSRALIFTVDQSEKVEAYCIEVNKNRVSWSRSILKEDINIRYNFRELLLTDEGEAYFLFEVDNSWNKKRKHRFELLHLADQTTKLEIEAGGTLTYDLSLLLSGDQDRAILSQTYTEKANNKCNGICTWTVDLPNMKEATKTVVDFKEELPESPKLSTADINRGLSDLALRNVIPRSDGGVVILCESSKEYTRRPSFATSASMTRRWVDYYFEDVLVFSIGPTGNLDWFEVLHKKQYSQDDDASYSSFFLFKIPAQLRLIYNDEIKNGNTVSEYILDSDGLRERKSLMSTDHQDLKLKFREAVQLNNREILVPSMQSNNLTLVKIKYDRILLNNN